MTLDVLICTYNEGIARVPEILLPMRDDVRYVVSFQYSDEVYLRQVPQILRERADVLVSPVSGRGLARNRNHSLSLIKADVALFADDDVRYQNRFFDTILQTFRTHDAPDIACFMALKPDGCPLHHYHDSPFDYAKKPYGVFFSSCEIVFRPSSRLPRVDERFGKGASYLMCGEEEVFLHQAYTNGLKIRFYPRPIVITEGNTTGTRFFAEPKVQRSKGAVLYVIHGFWGALARITKYSLVHVKSNRLSVWYQMWLGIRYIQQSQSSCSFR